MARQTRAQRRARREQQADASSTQRAPARQASNARPPAEPPRGSDGDRRPVGGGGGDRHPVARRGGASGFIAESWGELQKVEWPGQRQVMQGTIVVIIACAIVGSYLWGADLVLKRLVQNVLLGQ